MAPEFGVRASPYDFSSYPGDNRYPDTVAQCRIRCGIDFVNPFPEKMAEKAAEKAFGQLTADFLKKFNKGKAAYDVAHCLDKCNDQFPVCRR
jgi:hypothetical protein